MLYCANVTLWEHILISQFAYTIGDLELNPTLYTLEVYHSQLWGWMLHNQQVRLNKG